MNTKLKTANKLKLGVAAAFMFFSSGFVDAQQVVSLEDAISAALQNKADAKKANSEIKRAELKIDEAKAGALPQISVGGNLQYNPMLQQNVITMENEQTGEKSTMLLSIGGKWSSQIAATVNQALFDQRVFIGLKAAKSTREFYVLNAQLTNEQIIENVATAYYQVFVQEENLETIEASYTNTEKVRNVIKSLVDNGLAKSIDLDRTNVQLTNIGATKQQLVNAVELAKNALKFYMGVPIDTPIELEEKTIEPKPELIAEFVNVEDRSEMKVLNKQRELLEFNKKATEAYLYPTVSLQANYGWFGTGDKFPWVNGKNNGVNWSDFSNIGINFNIPIFTGGATKSKIQQAQIDIDNLDVDIAETKLGLDLEYQNAISNIENSIINLESMEENVKLAEKVKSNTQSNYQYGLATLTELLDAENALTQAKQNKANALLDYKQAEIQLIKAKGQLNTLQTP